MFEKVNLYHPDKIMDRIAGAMVDLAYTKDSSPRIAVEGLIGHGECHIIAESSVHFDVVEVEGIVHRIAGEDISVFYKEVPQDPILSQNQKDKIRCGDNGIFKGLPISSEQKKLQEIAYKLSSIFPFDGKYILHGKDLIVCQSNAKIEEVKHFYPKARVNPLGDWCGGLGVDTGAVNRKLGSDMGFAITGSGLHGKDLTKADVSLNIYAHLKATKERHPVKLYCAIGDEIVDGRSYSDIVSIARDYINSIGGFEKFAEWGIIR